MNVKDTIAKITEARNEVVQAHADGDLDRAMYREVVAALNTAKSQLAQVVTVEA